MHWEFGLCLMATVVVLVSLVLAVQIIWYGQESGLILPPAIALAIIGVYLFGAGVLLPEVRHLYPKGFSYPLYFGGTMVAGTFALTVLTIAWYAVLKFFGLLFEALLPGRRRFW